MTEGKGRVTGLGGIFVKTDDRDRLVKWYQETLGFQYDGYGANFLFRDDNDPTQRCYNVWGPFKTDTDYFKPSKKEFMVNLRVDDLDALLVKLKAAGIELVGEPEEYEYGKFAWIVDPEGTKLELWEQIGDVPEPNIEAGNDNG